MFYSNLNTNYMELKMADLAQWEKENQEFLIKIGQVAPKATPKPTIKKEEE